MTGAPRGRLSPVRLSRASVCSRPGCPAAVVARGRGWADWAVMSRSRLRGRGLGPARRAGATAHGPGRGFVPGSAGGRRLRESMRGRRGPGCGAWRDPRGTGGAQGWAGPSLIAATAPAGRAARLEMALTAPKGASCPRARMGRRGAEAGFLIGRTNAARRGSAPWDQGRSARWKACPWACSGDRRARLWRSWPETTPKPGGAAPPAPCAIPERCTPLKS